MRFAAVTLSLAKAGGADRNRTCDLLIANETLCQLSYDPIHVSRNSFAQKIAARNLEVNSPASKSAVRAS